MFWEDVGVCVVKTHFVTGCVHSWEVRVAVKAATNFQYLKLLTTWNEARHMFGKTVRSGEEGGVTWSVDSTGELIALLNQQRSQRVQINW